MIRSHPPRPNMPFLRIALPDSLMEMNYIAETAPEENRETGEEK